MKVLIFGNGWLGNKFHNFFKGSIISCADITNKEEVRKEVLLHKPDVVLNCAGKTGKPNIDWCEEHKVEVYNSNVVGVFILASVCSELDSYLVHLGSGCIYEGDNNGRGFSEDDAPNFFGSFYSRTKIWSQEVLKEFPNVLQLRIRMPIDSVPSSRNFITKITLYKKVISVKNSVTILNQDFFNAVKVLIERRRVGIYNLVSPGAVDHKEVLDMYKEFVDQEFSYDLFSLDDLHKETKAKRSNCILNSDKLLGEVSLPDVKDALKVCLKEYSKNMTTIK